MCSQGRVNAVGRVLLQAGNDVAVHIERDGHRGVTGPLTRHLRMNSLGEQMANMGVSEVVETDVETKRAGQAPELIGDFPGAPWRAVVPRANQVVILEGRAEPQSRLCLLNLVPAKGLDG